MLWIFDEKIKIFDTKLRESTGNRSQIFSGGVGEVCDALSRVCALSGGGNPKNSRKIKNLRADSLLCLSWKMVGKRLILDIFHVFSGNF